NRYFRARTQLTASVDMGMIMGMLSSGGPVPGAAVRVTAAPLSGSGVETQYSFEGTTPAGVRQIVLGLRVNMECGCKGVSDFRLPGFRVEPGATAISRDFAAGLTGWAVSDGSAVAVEDGQLHVRAAAGQPLLLNSAPMAFDGENTPFKLTVTATVSPASAGS